MRLADYARQDRFFEFEPATGRFEPVELAVPRAERRGYCGIAQLLKIEGRCVLVATYCQEGDAWLSIGARRWPLYAPDLEMTHEESGWGFTCRFTIRRGAAVLISFEYPRQDRLLWIIDSTYDHLDFSLTHLLADVGDHAPASRDERLASFKKAWCRDAEAGSL